LASRRLPHTNDRDPNRRLRIGYVSCNFNNHCQRFFTVPVLSNHDRAKYEVFAYSSVEKQDEWTARLRGTVDVWRDVLSLNDAALVAKIREDRIDVLVDLTMHMWGNRLRVFAEKPAPVQITWLAYPGTTGLDAMDYRITDPYLDPPESPQPYSERSLCLPNTFWCYDPLVSDLEVNELPSAAGEPLTFGCLNGFAKVNGRVLEQWARVLQRLPQSRLLLLAAEGSPRQFVRDTLAANGVAPERVSFVGWLAYREYLATYRRIDIGLDCLPYNGHTTSLDSLWMGVPVVSQVGSTVVGRAGWSLASNLGLRELVAHDADEFVEIAVALAQSPARLAELRRGLRARMQASPLMDARLFASDLEAAYRRAWHHWCASAA
jgi:protein O-GlcNAc transferase